MTNTMKQPKILIVAAQPYNKTNQSRSYDSFFHQFDKNNLVQIFSDSRVPCKGHCSLLYQITDKQLLKARLHGRKKVGRIFKFEDLPNEWNYETSQKGFTPKKKGPVYRFLRKFIWKKKYWDTEELEKFVSDFNPNCIFLAFSKDFFIFDIAVHFADKLNLPIIVSIMDDYYFYDEYKGQLLNKQYRKRFDKVVNNLMSRDVCCVFESEKIRRRYTDHFKVPGDVIYIASNIKPTKSSEIDLSKDWYYFGNLEFGRFDSLIDIAQTLQKYNKKIKIHIYSADYNLVKPEKNLTNLILHGPVPYAQMLDIAQSAGALLIVEGNKKSDVKMVEYSLSTKVGDTLCMGKPVIAFGHKDAGAISFLLENKCCYIATNNNDLETLISDIANGFNDPDIYDKQFQTAKKYFSINEQSERFLEISERFAHKSET